MALTGELYETIVRIVKEQVGEIKVTREDFDKLSKVVSDLSVAVRELAEAQKRTEFALSSLAERVDRLDAATERLEATVNGLAEAQKRTDEAVRGLAEAQKRTDEKLAELAEAQKRTDERLGELAEAQKRTDEKLGELAEAQKRTEEAVRELAQAQKRTDQAVGRLTDTIGHDLESIARVNVPDWLRLYEGVKVPELERRVFTVDGVEVEVDLYGEGVKGRTPTAVLGEVKSTIHDHDVEAFSARVDRLKDQLHGRVVKIMFGYWIHPSAQQEARKLQVRVIAPPSTYSEAGRHKR